MTENINNLLRVSLLQYDIAWEDKDANLKNLEQELSNLDGKTDLVVLPEMFSTGFSMNSRNLAESLSGKTITAVKSWATRYNIAIIGSYIAEDGNKYFNRGFFISPSAEHYYDKRHLFRMGEEPRSFLPGNKKLIVEYKGFNICLLVCYDLRFPVWSRNCNNEYDLLIYVANWPASRTKVWDTLLNARAIENMAFVCGVNRIGKDGNGLLYNGNSKLIDARGNVLLQLSSGCQQTLTVSISKKELDDFRTKFPVWKDADSFKLD